MLSGKLLPRNARDDTAKYVVSAEGRVTPSKIILKIAAA